MNSSNLFSLFVYVRFRLQWAALDLLLKGIKCDKDNGFYSDFFLLLRVKTNMVSILLTFDSNAVKKVQ